MTPDIFTSARALGDAFEHGRADPRDITEACIHRIETGDSDHCIFYRRTFARARIDAAAAHTRAKAGLRRAPLDGVPLSWKDLFDSAGDETCAGSPLLAGRVPVHDAAALARLTQAGAVCLGKTAMTELAFSGLGINPAFGTPANPHDSTTARVPGGSSSGAAVSVARRMCAAAIGTDTGGSVRIPAAWNGLVGFKPSFGRIPTDGSVPLCPSLDTIGPLTQDVEDAALLFAALTATRPSALDDETLNGRTIICATGLVEDTLAPDISAAVSEALSRIAAHGARTEDAVPPPLARMDHLTWQSGISLAAVEAWAVWGATITRGGDRMYPPVRARFEGGAAVDAAAAWRQVRERQALRADLAQRMAGADAIALPTVPIDPPPITALEAGGPAYDTANKAALRATSLANQLDLCAITLPAGLSRAGLPVGLMLMAPRGRDARLLRLARAAEKALAG